MDIRRDSRFVGGSILTSDGEDILEQKEGFRIKERYDDVLHKVAVEEEGRLDKISYKYYDTERLWWCIAMRNKIVDVVGEVIAGTNLFIPRREYLLRILRAR